MGQRNEIFWKRKIIKKPNETFQKREKFRNNIIVKSLETKKKKIIREPVLM